MAATDKDTIYIDIDDEITGVIDKVKNSASKVVALVLPKRASVFQSIVNMKLLKKAADSSKKNVVLITGEVGILPLAGAAGVHVAKTLTTKPEIPAAPLAINDSNEAIDEETEEFVDDNEPEVDPKKTLGQLAGVEAVASAASTGGVETVDLDNTVPDKEEVPKGKAKDKDKTKKDKSLKVPNFNKFRKYLIIAGIILLVLIILFFLFGSALAKATINISTNSSNVDTNLNLVLSTTATSASAASGTIPAKQDSLQKTYSQQVTTTGQVNQGNKASGSLQMSATECAPNLGQPSDIPAGSGVTSGGLTYITQQDTTFNSFGSGKGSCITYAASSDTPIIAQAGGSNYNNATGFSVPNRADVSVKDSSSISGGTDNIVQTVNQNDINNAKSKISTSNSQQTTLVSQLKGEGYYPISSTYSAGTPNATNSANVGAVANSVTVTEIVTYTMFGVHESDLKSLVDNSVDGQIDTSKQSILSEGLNQATFNPGNLSATGGQVAMSTVAIAGPQLNIQSIQEAAKGQKAGAIEGQISNDPGVTNVSVKIGPFWKSTAPTDISKIKVVIAKPTKTQSRSN